MKALEKLLLMPLLIFLCGGDVQAQSAWKLSTEKEGIKVYTSEFPDSKIKAIKVECEVNATASQIVALLMDVNTSADWVYHVKACQLIKQVSPSELYYYSEVNMPWPVANRDFVAHLIVSQDPVTKTVVVDGPCVTGLIPERKGVVRIGNSTGKWIITPGSNDQTKIEYSIHVDPGGHIPAWMVNMFATEGPLRIFEQLKMRVQKPEYKNAVLPFIDNKQYAMNAKF